MAARLSKPKPPELDNELQFHIEELVQEKIARGLTPDEARREAALEFGGQEQIKEELRDVHRIPLVDPVLTETRYAWRVLRRSPSFSLTIIATLALGIGANTAVFSAIDAVLLRPLPYPNPDRLVVLHEYRSKQERPETFLAPARLEDWSRLNGSFRAISGYMTEDTVDASGPLPVKIKRAFVAPQVSSGIGRVARAGTRFFDGRRTLPRKRSGQRADQRSFLAGTFSCRRQRHRQTAVCGQKLGYRDRRYAAGFRVSN